MILIGIAGVKYRRQKKKCVSAQCTKDFFVLVSPSFDNVIVKEI
jgi:hypothetical protein